MNYNYFTTAFQSSFSPQEKFTYLQDFTDHKNDFLRQKKIAHPLWSMHKNMVVFFLEFFINI